MDEMSKTPEEIKKGLECAVDKKCVGKECLYFNEEYACIRMVQIDALALIQQLEAENAELLEKIKRLERELDALLALLREYAACETCKYECPPEKEEVFFNECIGCDKEICKCRECGEDCEHWEWRGTCEENGGSDA